MSRELPIACTLSGAELASRVAEIRALGEHALLDATEAPGRAVLTFRPDADVRERLEAIVAAESECCAFLDFDLERGAEAAVLTISAPNGGSEVVHELAGAFAGRG
jgi:hypothetical protein